MVDGLPCVSTLIRHYLLSARAKVTQDRFRGRHRREQRLRSSFSVIALSPSPATAASPEGVTVQPGFNSHLLHDPSGRRPDPWTVNMRQPFATTISSQVGDVGYDGGSFGEPLTSLLE